MAEIILYSIIIGAIGGGCIAAEPRACATRLRSRPWVPSVPSVR